MKNGNGGVPRFKGMQQRARRLKTLAQRRRLSRYYSLVGFGASP